MATGTLSPTTALEERCAAHFGCRHALALGRATWALALLLREIGHRCPRRRIALPSFLCHAPLAAVSYAGWTPVFCDVDPATGLVPDSEWAAAMDLGADAVLLVHLFGNPAPVDALSALCRARRTFLIEDACQAIGASIAGSPCGAHGDAALLSFGHSKAIDVGSGGVLLTDDDALAEAVARAASTQAYGEPTDYERLSGELSRRFYQAKERALLAGEEPSAAFSGLIDDWRALVPTPWSADATEICRQLDRLPQTATERRRKAALYLELLAGTPMQPIEMSAQANPWRFCFRVPGISRSRQEALSGTLRHQGIHVSNWYLPTQWMASRGALATGPLAHTAQLSTEIFQLWLDEATPESQIRANAAAAREAICA